MRHPSVLALVFVTVLSALGPWAPARAACPQEREATALSARLDAAGDAYTALEVEAFTASMDDAAFAIPCLSEVVSPGLAARYHRMVGLRLFVAREEDRAVRSFAAARALEPDSTMPVTLVPEGHEIHALYDRFDLASGRATEVLPPEHGWLVFDGRRGLERPTHWPSLVQVVGGDGQVVDSAYVFPEDSLPAYRVDPTLEAAARRRRARARGTLLAVGGGSAVAAGVAYGLAAAHAASFERDHPDWNRTDLAAHRTRTNALATTSVVLGMVAVSSITVGVLVEVR